MTSAARWVLSSTSAPTKKAGIVMSRASPQTTMSFTPIDRDFTLKLDCNIDKSLTKYLHSSGSFALQSYLAKKSSGPRRRQAVYQARRGPFFRHFCRIPNHLLESGQIFNVARTSGSRDSADSLRTVAVIFLHGLDHFPLLQNAQMPVQIAVRESTKLFELAERQSFRVRDQRRQHTEARALVNHAIQAFIGEAPFAARSLSFHSFSSFPVKSSIPATSNCPTPYGIPMAHGESARPSPSAIQVRPVSKYHAPTAATGRGRKRHDENTPRLKTICQRPGSIHKAAGT